MSKPDLKLRARYQDMVDRHMTLQAMAKAVGKSVETVSRYLDYHSIVPRKPKQPRSTRAYHVTQMSDHSSSRHAQSVVNLSKEPWLE